jgi:hypothetical protein
MQAPGEVSEPKNDRGKGLMAADVLLEEGGDIDSGCCPNTSGYVRRGVSLVSATIRRVHPAHHVVETSTVARALANLPVEE